MKGVSIMVATNNSIKTSAMYIGYLILKEIQDKKTERVSIYDISKSLKQKGINSSRQLVLGLSFLYSVDIVDFEEANIWVKR